MGFLTSIIFLVWNFALLWFYLFYFFEKKYLILIFLFLKKEKKKAKRGETFWVSFGRCLFLVVVGSQIIEKKFENRL
jgi:hypothetical protein